MTHKEAIEELKARMPRPLGAEDGRFSDAITMACISLNAEHHTIRLADKVERLQRENASLLRDAALRYGLEAEQTARVVFAAWRRSHCPNLTNREIDSFERGLNQALLVLNAGVSAIESAAEGGQ